MSSSIIEDAVLFTASSEEVKTEMNAQLESDIIKELLQTKTLFGEILDYNYYHHLEIDSRKVSHVLLSYRWDNLILYGNIEILNNMPNGKFLFITRKTFPHSIIWVPRILGKKDNAGNIINIGKLITFDWTSNT